MMIPERIAYAREPQRLPVVLSADEVVRILEAVPSLKSRTALTTVYAAGLRVSEVVRLAVADIDSARLVIRGEQGKGGQGLLRDAVGPAVADPRTYWRIVRPGHWLFPGREPDWPIDQQVLHAACKSARAAAGLSKHVTVPLRHSFATHLLENGTFVRIIQVCWGTPACRERCVTPGSPLGPSAPPEPARPAASRGRPARLSGRDVRGSRGVLPRGFAGPSLLGASEGGALSRQPPPREHLLRHPSVTPGQRCGP